MASVRNLTGQWRSPRAPGTGQARARLPFSLTWWSFTFPVETLVTGTSGLAEVTRANALDVAAVGLYAALVAAWAVVATRTAAGVWTGELLRGPLPAPERRAVRLA